MYITQLQTLGQKSLVPLKKIGFNPLFRLVSVSPISTFTRKKCQTFVCQNIDFAISVGARSFCLHFSINYTFKKIF